jgi:hypothetical protein
MARCPVCLQKVTARELLRQSTARNYTCVRCGRSWRFTGLTVGLSLVIALAPIFYIVSRPHEGTTDMALAASQALLASAVLYVVSLLLFGKLDATSRRRR